MAVLLKGRQIDAIKCMLNFNTPPSSSDVPQWKVLIYDQLGRDIISPLLNVKELRALGITLHLLLDSPRELIPDVPAIYFVYPSQENILAICKDFEYGRYESYYLNFISPISRESLELIAQTALSEDCVQQIAKVFDQHTNFICLEDDLLVLRPLSDQKSLSYYALNRTKATDADINETVDAIVDGLFSVFATLGAVPIIRCPRGNASEMVATRLETRLRDSLRDSRNSLFLGTESSRGYNAGGGFGRESQGTTGITSSNLAPSAPFSNFFQRPLLVLLDRNLDLATPLHHELTYQSLVHDIFTIRLNRVKVDLGLAEKINPEDTGTESNLSSQKKKSHKTEQYDLSISADRLWREFRGSFFSDVAEAIREEVTILRDYEKSMGELKSSMGLAGETTSVVDSALTLLDDNTARLTNAVNSLPQLMERKRCLDMHTNIATCLANVITHRQLHLFAEIEDKLLTNQAIPDSDLSDLIKDGKVGSAEDKLRLVVFAALLRNSNSTVGTVGSNAAGSTGASGGAANSGVGGNGEFRLSDTELTTLKQLLGENCPQLDLSAIDYVERIRHLSKSGQMSEKLTTGLHPSASRSMLNKFVSQGSALLRTGVRNLIGRKSYLPFTRIVSQLMENKGGSEVEDYLYFDPKLYRRQTTDTPRFKQPFYDAIVFVVGGGSYVEYQNLLDWVRTTSGTSMSSANLTGMTNGSGNSLTGSGSTESSRSTSGLGATMSSRRITYGCTDLVNANEFLSQLTRLGQEL